MVKEVGQGTRDGWSLLYNVWALGWGGWNTRGDDGWELKLSGLSSLTWLIVNAGCWLGPQLGLWTVTPTYGFSAELLGLLLSMAALGYLDFLLRFQV